MTAVARAFLAFLVVAALGGVGHAYAQDESLSVDPQLAKRGKSLFTSKGCLGCHSIGKGKRSGPDLAGVTQRRSLDWLRRYLKDPPAMMETDSIAQELLEEYNYVKMPNLRLRDADIEALLHYIESESPETSGDTQ